MILNIPLIKQKPNSHACGIICSYMVLKYKKYNINLKTISRNIKIRKGIIGPQLVKGLLKLNINVELIVYAPQIFYSSSIKDLEKVYRKTKIKHLRSSIKQMLDIKEAIKIEPINSSLLIRLIRKKIAPIVLISSSVFRKRFYGRQQLHYVVVCGYDRSYFFVNDPHPKFGGRLKIKKEDLISSIYFQPFPQVIVIK
jgi:uncharacterized protein YvpB